MVNIFLASWGKPLLILHALIAILLLGSMTHHVLIVVPYLWGTFNKVKLEKIYVKVAFIAYLLTFIVGALIYPNYRYHVRDQYFDAHLPWAAQLFDMKEHWAGLGLALFIGFLLISRVIHTQSDRAMLGVYVWLSVTLSVIIWFNVISGLLLVSYRSI